MHNLVKTLLPARERALARLEERADEIPSPIREDPDAREQFFAHVGVLYDLIVQRMAGAEPLEPVSLQSLGTPNPLTRQVARARAGQGIHPRHSLAAAVLASDVISDIVYEVGGRDAESRDRLARRLPEACVHVLSQVLYTTSAEHLAALLETTSDSQARERQRISRELHDDTGHGLAVSQRQLELAAALLRGVPDTDSAQAALQQGLESIITTMKGLRRMLAGLRADEHVVTLESSLTHLISITPFDYDVQVDVGGDEATVPPAIRREVFLMIREGLRNAQRHAQATAAEVRVRIKPSQLIAEVKDNGVGLDETHAEGGGMTSLRQRASILDGHVDWLSSATGGTTIVITVPLTS